MNSPLPPQYSGQPPAPKKPNWLLLGCGGCLGLIVLGGIAGALIIWGVFGAIKASPPYQTALAGAINSPEVQAELGAPIKPGWMLQSNVSTRTTNGVTTGNADINFPINGPKGSGQVHYSATQSNEGWKVNDFFVTIDGTGKRIELKQ
jgi:hypothetical protein